MIQKEITAQVPEKKNAEGELVQQALGPATIFVDYPETLQEAEEWAGGEAILSNAFANFRVNPIQSGIRAALKAGLIDRVATLEEVVGQAARGRRPESMGPAPRGYDAGEVALRARLAGVKLGESE